MKFRIVTGQNPCLLMDRCLEFLAGQNKVWPEQRAFLIVPDHMKADMERRFLEIRRSLGDVTEDRQALMLLDVVSFQRLASRILAESGGLSGLYPDSAIRSLLLYRVLYESREELSTLAAMAGKVSFLPEIDEVLRDFTRCNIRPEDLDRMDMPDASPAFQRKIRDFALLMRRFFAMMEERGYDEQRQEPDVAFRVLSDLQDEKKAGTWPLKRLSFLKNTSIWVAGYGSDRGLTPQEWNLLCALHSVCEEVHFCIASGEHGTDKSAESTDVFHVANRTIRSLTGAFPDVSILTADQLLEKSALASSNTHPALWHAAQNFAYHTEQIFHTENVPVESRIYPSVTEELRFVAGEIKHLVLSGEVRYRDIRVLLCDGSSYESHLYSVFSEYGLDPFIDRKRPLSETVLLRFILAFLDLGIRERFVPALFTCLKSGLCPILSADVDELENFCLRYGLDQGTKILHEEDFLRLEVDTAPRMWALVQRVVSVLVDHSRHIVRAKTCAEKAQRTLTFIEEYRKTDEEAATDLASVIRALTDEWADAENQDSALSLAASYRELVALLQKMTGPAGETELSHEGFRDMLEAGMRSVFSGAIPTYADQIEIVDNRRGESMKMTPILFIVGASSEVFPYRRVQDGFFKSHEKAVLSEKLQIQIPDKWMDQMYSDAFSLYTTLCSVSSYCYISCVDRGEPSTAMLFLHRLFPSAKPIVYGECDKIWDVRLYSRDPLLRVMRAWMHLPDGEQQNPEGMQISEQMIQKKRTAESFFSLYPESRVDSAVAVSETGRVSPELLRLRYPDSPEMSVSQWETYAICPYRHFLSYVLRLKERARYQLQLSDMGSFLHKMMELGMREFSEAWASAEVGAREEICRAFLERDYAVWCRGLLAEAVTELRLPATMEDRFFGSSAENLVRTAQWSLQGIFRGLHEGAGETDGVLYPCLLEWKFGSGAGVPSGAVEGVRLRGVVDRIDIREDTGQFRIVDYKSSDKKPDYVGLYHGTSLQLPIYSKVFAEAFPQYRPCSVGYMHLTPFMQAMKSPSAVFSAEDHERNLAKEYSLNTMALDETSLPDAGAHALDRIREQSERLFSGDFSVRPVRTKGANPPCQYCPYVGVCHIDPAYPPCKSLTMPPVTREDGTVIGKNAEAFQEFLRKKKKANSSGTSGVSAGEEIVCN